VIASVKLVLSLALPERGFINMGMAA
jgi:hypothetical protein